MILQAYEKQPWERKDYDTHYAPWLAASEDTIDSYTVDVVCVTDPNDTTLVCDESANTDTTIKIWIAGGTAGKQYKVTIKMITAAGRKDESELMFKVKEY